MCKGIPHKFCQFSVCLNLFLINIKGKWSGTEWMPSSWHSAGPCCVRHHWPCWGSPWTFCSPEMHCDLGYGEDSFSVLLSAAWALRASHQFGNSIPQSLDGICLSEGWRNRVKQVSFRKSQDMRALVSKPDHLGGGTRSVSDCLSLGKLFNFSVPQFPSLVEGA